MLRKMTFALLAAAFWSVPAGFLMAEDPLAVAPDMYKLLYENERIRVMEVVFKPEQKIGKHSHPDHFAYVLSGGKLRISKPDGSVSDVDLQPKQVVWINAETHWAENIGQTTVDLLVTELKEPKSAMPAATPTPSPTASPTTPKTKKKAQ